MGLNDDYCPHLLPGAAPDLLPLPAEGEGVSGVQSGLPGAAQETQVSVNMLTQGISKYFQICREDC